MGLSAGIDDVINASPELITSPGMALDAASSNDPTNVGTTLSHAANLNATAQAYQTSEAQDENPDDPNKGSGGGLLGALGSAAGYFGHAFQSLPGAKQLESGIGAVAKSLGVPLHEVQRDYKYLHMQWKQNPVVGFIQTLGVLGGAAAGGLATGSPTGAILGGEAAATALRAGSDAGMFGGEARRLAGMADDPNVKISLGRDVANAIGHVPGLSTLENTDSGWGKVISGTTDAVADFAGDPIILGAKLKTGLKLGEYASLSEASNAARAGNEAALTRDPTVVRQLRNLLNGDFIRLSQSKAAQGWMDAHAPGIKITNPDSIDQLYHSGLAGDSYRRATEDIARINGGDNPGGTLLARYPNLGSLVGDVKDANDANVILPGLNRAKTGVEVHEFFKRVAADANFAARLDNAAVLPTRTRTRAVGSTIAEWARNIDAGTPVADQKTLTGGTLSALKNVAKGDLAGAKADVAGAAARKIRTFSGYMPFSVDKNTLGLSTNSFTWSPQGVDPKAAWGVYQQFKYSMGEQRARYWTDQFLNATDEAAAKRIWSSGQMETLISAGLPKDNDLVTNLQNQINDLGTSTVDKQVYGYGLETGSDVGLQPMGDLMTQRALMASQASTVFHFPNYNVLRQEMRVLQGSIKANYGKMDDIVARKFIGTIFKPMALGNLGFAQRVSLAEMMPQAMREGGLKTLRDFVNSRAATLNYKLFPATEHAAGEEDDVLAAASHALQDSPTTWDKTKDYAAKYVGKPYTKGRAGAYNGLNVLLNDPLRRDFALRMVMDGNGHLATGVAATGGSGGYGLDNDVSERNNAAAYAAKNHLKNHPQLRWANTGDFRLFSQNDDKFDGYLHKSLSDLANDKPSRVIARDLLDNADHTVAEANEASRIQAAVDGTPDAHYAYNYEAQRLAAYDNIKAGNWTAKDFAYRKVDAVRGALHGSDGTFNRALAEKVANGQAPTLQEIEALPLEARPAQVYGPVTAPYLGPNLLNRIINNGFAKVIDPTINHLSRDPIYFESTFKEYQNLKPLLESGAIDEDTAYLLAKQRGAVSMLPKIHNTALRSQFSQLARNYLPFYFAQEQALRRAATLIATNPEALRGYQLIEHGLNDPGFVQTDGQGNKYMVLPMAGALTGAIQHLQGGVMGNDMQYGLPISVTGSMSSLNTVLPEMQQPGVSPMVSVPLNWMTSMFPELSPTVKSIVGSRGFGQSAVDALLPSPITKNLYRFVDPDAADRSFANAYITSIATAVAAGKAPLPDATAEEQATFLAKMKNDTRSSFMAKLFLGMVSPLAPQVSIEHAGWRNEFEKLINENVNGKPRGVKDALQIFLKEHGQSAVSYTIAHSAPNVDGATMPYTYQAMNWLNSNSALINSKFATGAAFLVPQAKGPGDVQTIHSELIRQKLRQNLTPQDFLNAVDVAQGNADISDDLTKHTAAQAKLAGNSAAQATESANWANYVKLKANNNPVWYDNWTSKTRTNTAVKAFNDLKMLVAYQGQTVKTSDGTVTKVPTLPPGEQTSLVLGLMQDYEAHASKMSRVYNTPGSAIERANWKAYLDQKANEDQRLYPIIQSVFGRLDAGESYGQLA